MTNDKALEMIQQAANLASPGVGDKVTMETDLKNNDMLDSLDRMNFLFELEELNGSKLEQITDTFDDFRVATLVGFLTAS